MLKAVGVADGDRDLAEADALRVPETRPGQAGTVEPYDRQVRVRVVSDEIRASRSPVGQRHADVGRLRDHMAVGEDEAVGCEEHAGADGAAAIQLDLDDRRPGRLHGVDDGARVRVQQFVVSAGRSGIQGHVSV